MLLQVSNIGKSYGTTVILSNINLQVNERERIGLVGVNGAGKSTLLKIIAGEMSYDQGTIYKSKETKIGYLAQNSGLQSDRTILEEMLDVFAEVLETEQELRRLEESMSDPEVMADESRSEEILNRYAAKSERFREKGGYEIEAKIRGILHGMGFGGTPQDTVVNTLSGGQKTRLALTKMLLQEPDLLLLDEPTNHLDIETLTWLEDYLRGYRGAILVVSHDRYFLDALAVAIYEIERHEAKRYTGNYSRFVELKEAQYEIELKHFERQQEEIARMEDFIRRNIVRATTTKRAQSRRKALERMDRLDKPQGELKRAAFSFEIERTSGKDVLQAYDLAGSYERGKPLFRGVSFELKRGDSAAMIGPNGIGKSTLLKILTGRMEPTEGEFYWGTNVKIGYYDQEQGGLTPDNTVLEELWSTYPHMEEVRIRTVLGNFLFSGEDVLKKVSALSGGEKARVSLAKLMLQNANMLILDEPTNHLDLYSKEVLESALAEFEGTLLFISHDRYFLNKMADRVLEMSSAGVTAFLGNYDDYTEKKIELAELAAESQPAARRGGGAGASTAGGRAGAGAAAGAESGLAPGDGAGAGMGGAMSGAASGGSGAGTSAAGGGPVSGSETVVGTADAGGSSGFAESKQAKREERTRQRRLEQLEADIARLEAEVAAFEEELAKPEVYQDYKLVQETQSSIDERKSILESHYAEWETLIG